MAGTYVQLTREEFEDWLDRDLKVRGKWKVKPGTSGVYQVKVSDNVAIEINSTTGSKSQVRDRGRASMKLRLVSLVDGRVLNKKAQGQNHFKRTVNWRQTWKKGFGRMKAAYLKSQGFYEKIADREGYLRTWVGHIEAIPGWEGDRFLSQLHDKVSGGGVLYDGQEQKILDRAQGGSDVVDDAALELLRDVYRGARRSGDRWTMDFTESIAKRIKSGRPLTPRQQEILDEKTEKYARARRVAGRWL